MNSIPLPLMYDRPFIVAMCICIAIGAGLFVSSINIFHINDRRKRMRYYKLSRRRERENRHIACQGVTVSLLVIVLCSVSVFAKPMKLDMVTVEQSYGIYQLKSTDGKPMTKDGRYDVTFVLNNKPRHGTLTIRNDRLSLDVMNRQIPLKPVA